MTFGESGLLMTLLAFLLVLTPLVFVHELGHFLVARWLGVRVETFSIGFGRELFGWNDRKGTRWRIAALPLGGYVRFFGDANAASQADAEAAAAMSAEDRAHAFAFQPVLARALIVLAGPVANFLFAILIFAGLFMALGQLFTPPVVGQVVPGSPAERAGILVDDRILSVNGEAVRSFEDLRLIVGQRPQEELEVAIDRAGREISVSLVPARHEERDRFGNLYISGRIGLVNAAPQVIRRGPVDAVWHATLHTADMTRAMLKGLGDIILGKRSIDELGGPIKIADMANEVAMMGIISVVGFMALISVNLGLVNLLPIPMLDGGHLLLYAVEAIRRQPVSQRAQEWAFTAGLIFLVSFFAVVTLNDAENYGFLSRVTNLFG